LEKANVFNDNVVVEKGTARCFVGGMFSRSAPVREEVDPSWGVQTHGVGMDTNRLQPRRPTVVLIGRRGASVGRWSHALSNGSKRTWIRRLRIVWSSSGEKRRKDAR